MQTAVDYLIEQLQAPCRGIPSHIIEQANKMFEEQIMDAYDKGSDVDEELKPLYGAPEQYYNGTYNKDTNA